MMPRETESWTCWMRICRILSIFIFMNEFFTYA
jgi:hypothetical protein